MAGMYVAVEIVGLKEALKELNRFDKTLRRQITKDYKQVVKPIQDDAKAAIAQIGAAPMSGWERSWNPQARRRGAVRTGTFSGGRRLRDAVTEIEREEKRLQAAASGGIFPWDTSKAQKMLKAKINTKATKQFAGSTVNLAVFSVSWLGAADQVFATAGRESSGKTKSGQQMIRTLNERHGNATRILWPAYEKNKDVVDRQLKELAERVMAAVNKKAVFTQRGGVN